MKTLCVLLIVIAAIVFSASAAAGTLATLSNTAGGDIEFTDMKVAAGSGCPSPEGYVVFGRTTTGQTIFGCWSSDETNAFVYWYASGQWYTYPLDQMQMTPYGIEWGKKRHKGA